MNPLTTRYLGLELRSPIVASAGPYTGDLDRLAELDDAGVGAVVMPSLFEEQIEHETNEIDRLFTVHSESFGEATTFFADVDEYNTGVDTYLAMVQAARTRVHAPVIASLNGTNVGGWLRYGRLLADAGADAVELNLSSIVADPSVTGAMVEAEQLELVALLCDDIDLPVAVKISPFYTSVAAFARGLEDAGVAGIVMFNKFYLPDLDLETLDIVPRIALSTPDELRLPLRWIGIVRDFVSVSLAASTGVHSGGDAAKVLLAGADVAMTTSALLHHGPTHVATIERELRDWMAEHDYESVDQMRGAVRREAAADPNAYERATYIGTLTSFTSRFMSGSHD